MYALGSAAASFTEASVTAHIVPPRGLEGLALRVREPAALRRLAAFFPHAWDDVESHVGGGWVPCLRIEFFAPDGSSRIVLVSPNFKYYSIRGDWPLRPGLEGFLAALRGGRQGGSPLEQRA